MISSFPSPGCLAGTGQDKADLAAVSVCPVVSGFPLGDVVLSRRQEERWHPDFRQADGFAVHCQGIWLQDRKSTRLNSSHVRISYAVFCLKKKNVQSLLLQVRLS